MADRPPWVPPRPVRSGWATLALILSDLPAPAAARPDRRACQNDRDHAGGDWCPGWLTFEPGEPQAKCDVCGAWCGVQTNGDPACPRTDGWEVRRG
jgi:hypothetical protein